MRKPSGTGRLGAAVLAAGLLFWSSGVFTRAQQPQRSPGNAEATSNTQRSLELPVRVPALRVSVEAPEEVRVGDSYEYTVTVTNATEDLVVHDVVLKQKQPASFKIESAEIQQSQAGQKQPQQAQQQKQNQNQSGQQQSEQSQAQSQNKQEWTIPELKPGESRVITVKATSDQEGAESVCILVTSYTPTICIPTKFVKPELEIAKRAPEKATVCEDIEVQYIVKNSGTGALAAFEVRDTLGDGLQTIEGEQELKFEVDGLEAGQSREFTARLRADRAGEFSSRAVAVTEDGKETRSASTTLQVVSPQLAVAIDGPKELHVGRTSEFTVRVTNQGDAAAEQAELQLQFNEQVARLESTGEVANSDRAVEQPSGNGEAQPTPAANQSQPNDQEQNAQPQQERANRNQPGQRQQAAQSWEIGTIEPGATRAVTFRLKGIEGGKLDQRAVAEFVCAPDAEAMKTTAMHQAEVFALPALAIAVVDEQDPVAIEEPAVYRVIVQNEGTAPDKNIEISVDLPEQLEYVSASGPSEGSADGQTVKFQPVDQLEPGEKLVWTVETKVRQEGKAMFRADLKSEELDQPAIAEEPTRLFDGETSTESSSSDQPADQQQ